MRFPHLKRRGRVVQAGSIDGPATALGEQRGPVPAHTEQDDAGDHDSRIPIESQNGEAQRATSVSGSRTESDLSRTPISAARLDELEAQARYARQRYDLYKARAYGPRLTSVARMRELQRESARAEANLRFAEAEAEAERGVGRGVVG